MQIIYQILEIIFWFVIIVIPLVVVHEFGHFSISRIFGVKIPEFGVGMPVVGRTFYKRWKGVIWSFYWPLLGGFVRIFGDNDAADKAFEENKKDGKIARRNFITNRYQEILGNRELQFFLEDNGLEYDSTWQVFEKSKYKMDDSKDAKNMSDPELEKKYNQLATLIDWEFDANLKSKNTFFSKNWIQQTLIILGGITFNLLFAVLIYLFIFSGLLNNNYDLSLDKINSIKDDVTFTQKSKEITFSVVGKDSLATKAGLTSGDKLVTFAGTSSENINSLDDFRNVLKAHKNEEVTISYLNKDNQSKETKIKLEETNGKLVFGVADLSRKVSFSAKNIFSGIKLAVKATVDIFQQTWDILVKMFFALFPNSTDKYLLDGAGSIVAVGAVGGSIFKNFGVDGILELMAGLSVQLAIINLLPIPALDGGRFVILTINKILGKRSQKFEGILIGVTFILLISLSFFLIFKDIRDISIGKYNF